LNSEDARSRIVVFRLTPDEYDALKKASGRARRSMSDFTRAEVLSAISARPQQDTLDEIRAELVKVQNSIRGLKELIVCMMPERRRSAGGR
jgi:uncharacterized protein (DUF1778 family)